LIETGAAESQQGGKRYGRKPDRNPLRQIEEGEDSQTAAARVEVCQTGHLRCEEYTAVTVPCEE
jgi:hypothetical protein